MTKKKEQQKQKVHECCDHCGREEVLFTITAPEFNVTSAGERQQFKKFDFTTGVKFCSMACFHEWIDDHNKMGN